MGQHSWLISSGAWVQPSGEANIVAMDNCRLHKVAGVEEAIEARGARVEYLPAYSPDLNPIELSFSKFKGYLRKCSERDRSCATPARRCFHTDTSSCRKP